MIRIALKSATGFALLVCASVAGAQISLYATVDLARRNSSDVRRAQADVQRAEAGLTEARAAYVPSLTVGSSAGYSYGFPVGQPTLFNLQAQSLVISFSQPDYVRAARASLHAATLRLQDALDQVELDTALDYAQLSAVTEQIAALEEEKKYAETLGVIEQQRLAAGVESRIAATRAELTAAQSDLRRLDLLTQASLLRERLANRTGLFAANIVAEPKSIPAPPPAPEPRVREMPISVEASNSIALSKGYLAHGDARQSYRPLVGFGLNYQLFDTTVNDYNYYYLHPLQANNFSIGVQITLPVFDALRLARARSSAADAARASADAEQAREQSSEQTLQLEKSLVTLRAQARVAELQAALAGEQLQAVLLQTQNPTVTPGAAPLTPRDELEARIGERARSSEAIEARFALLRGQLSLLRATRQLREWINQGAH